MVLAKEKLMGSIPWFTLGRYGGCELAVHVLANHPLNLAAIPTNIIQNITYIKVNAETILLFTSQRKKKTNIWDSEAKSGIMNLTGVTQQALFKS